ncbi:MAG: hypothetical protein JWQ08_2829, partial [Deinococcus sp.]|nr:hypothetical protein [Deinococcus sp.]
ESLPIAALAERWAGQPASALALADQGAALAEQLDMPQMHQAAQAARGSALLALHRPQEALKAFDLAQTLAWEMGDQLAAHRAGLELDQLRGDLPGARERLAWFEQWGLGASVDLAQRLFPELTLKQTAEPGPASQHPPGEPGLRLEVLGALRCGVPGSMEAVRGRKRHELLTSLLEARLAGRPEVPRLDLLDLLSPGHDEVRADAALRDLVFHLREAYGAGLILTGPRGYALGDVASDAEDFLMGGDVRLWRGPWLDGVDTQPRDDGVRYALSHALYERAGALLAGNPDEATRLGRLLLDMDPYDQAALHLTLKALRAGQDHRSLNRLYRQARERLLDVGERLPERWADFLAAPSGAIP